MGTYCELFVADYPVLSEKSKPSVLAMTGSGAHGPACGADDRPGRNESMLRRGVKPKTTIDKVKAKLAHLMIMSKQVLRFD